MSEYDKMDTNKSPNIFGCHTMYQTNIQIHLNATYLPNKYPNIFVLQKIRQIQIQIVFEGHFIQIF